MIRKFAIAEPVHCGGFLLIAADSYFMSKKRRHKKHKRIFFFCAFCLLRFLCPLALLSCGADRCPERSKPGLDQSWSPFVERPVSVNRAGDAEEPHGTATEDPDSVGAFNLGQLRAEISAAYRAGGMPDDGVGRFFDLMSKPGG